MSRFKISCATVALALAILPVSVATAGQWSAVINGKSYHLDSTYDWNESNYGAGVEYQFASTSRWKTVVMANGFVDSTENMSYMAGAGLHRRVVESERYADFYVDVGLNAFLMTRDDYDDGKPFPGLLPSLSTGNRHVGINLTYLPKIAVEKFMSASISDPSLSGILFVQFKISLDRLQPQGRD
jgi:hypothetical protein